MHDAAEARRHLSLARSALRLGKEEVRRSVWAMRPLALEGQTLPEALAQLASHLNDGTPLGASFALRGKPRVLSAELNSNLLRIAQEAVANAIRHAHATRIKIQLAHSARKIKLTIADDGEGFKTTQARSNHGAGMANMRQRAERIGARLSILSRRRRGTRVTVALPMPGA